MRDWIAYVEVKQSEIFSSSVVNTKAILLKYFDFMISSPLAAGMQNLSKTFIKLVYLINIY